MVNKLQIKSLIIRVIISSLVFVALCSIALALFVSGRGVPYTDEAYYFLLAKFPTDVVGSVGAPQWIAGYLFEISGSLKYFRLTGVVLLLSGAIFLAYSVATFLSTNLTKRTLIALVASSVVSGLTYGSIINFSPSYNLLTGGFGYIAAALSIVIATRRSNSNKILLVILGGILGLAFIARPTSGAALIMLCIWFLQLALKKEIYSWIAVAGGFLSSVAVLVFHNSSPNDAFAMQKMGRALYGDAVLMPTFESLVTRYFNEITGIPIALIFEYPISILLLVLCALKPTKGRLITLITAICIELSLKDSWKGGQAHLIEMANPVFLILLVSLVLTFKSWFFSTNLRRLIQFCLLLPFALAFGTGNAITTGSLYFLTPLVIIIVVCVFIQIDSDIFIGRLFLTPIMLLILIGQFATSVFSDPYQMPYPYGAQKIASYTKSIGAIKVDKLTKSYIEQGKFLQSKCGWKDDTLFIGAYQNPGLPLVLSTKPYGMPWLTNSTQLSRLLSTDPVDLQEPLVLAQFVGLDGKSPSIIPEGIGFPKSFQFCGSISYPYANQTSRIFYRDGA
jgi:hypothetical protein